jgi:hypothetical protein
MREFSLYLTNKLPQKKIGRTSKEWNVGESDQFKRPSFENGDTKKIVSGSDTNKQSKYR